MDVEFDITLDVAKNISGEQILVYPNPASDFVTLGNIAGEASVKVYSMDGRLVKYQTLRASEKMDVSAWKNGLYTINIQDNKQSIRYKLIKK